MTDELDILIKNATIINRNFPSSRTDIGIRDGRISVIKPQLKDHAKRVIDAANMVTSAGFIDMHSHSDFIIPVRGSADSFVRQGITTTLVGMCGSGLAPIDPENREDFITELVKFMPPLKDAEINWSSFGEYLDFMEKTPFAINTAHSVGYESIRIAGGAGFDNRPPTKDEIDSMKALLTEAMRGGAFGMSTGLIYAPQVYADTTELIEICRVLAEYRGLYFSHIRGEGETVFDAIKEVREIVEQSNCRGGHIAHHKIADKRLWGKSSESLKLIEDINQSGVSLTYDSYPYERGCSSLITALPPWTREGGTERAVKRLKDESVQERIIKEVTEDINTDTIAIWENWIKTDGFENIFISSVATETWKHTIGLSIEQIAEQEKCDVWDIFFSILIDDEGSTMVTTKSMDEEDVKRVMTSEFQMFGTDGIATPQGYHYGINHPRSFGTFPRILGKYVREEKVISLEDALWKMTTQPAERLGLHDRGRLVVGAWADIVIFNPDTIIDTATFAKPDLFPIGIEYVIVNGEIVVEMETQNDVFPGKVLRHRASS